MPHWTTPVNVPSDRAGLGARGRQRAEERRSVPPWRTEHAIGRSTPRFDGTFTDTGVSSADAVEFITKVEEAFGVTIPPETFAEFKCLRDLATYLESRAG